VPSGQGCEGCESVTNRYPRRERRHYRSCPGRAGDGTGEPNRDRLPEPPRSRSGVALTGRASERPTRGSSGGLLCRHSRVEATRRRPAIASPLRACLPMPRLSRVRVLQPKSNLRPPGAPPKPPPRARWRFRPRQPLRPRLRSPSQTRAKPRQDPQSGKPPRLRGAAAALFAPVGGRRCGTSTAT
jgi:hypothetical protein